MSKGIIATGLVGVTSLVGACLANSCVYALNNSALDNVSVRIPVSCTMIGTLTSAHTTSIVSGQRIENIGATKINTSCNDKNGYVVYAIGSTGGTEGSNVLASTLGSASDIQTGDAAAGGSTSSWAMKLTASGTGDYTPNIVSEYTDYTSVPNQWTKVASLGAGTATGVDSAFNTTYAVYTISTQPAATYSGQVKYVMLHPSTAAQPTATLENAFALAGKQKITVTDPVTGDSGQFYKMQDMENSICSSATSVDENNSIRLVDTRDNKLYWVTKLKDGHCWMTQNLDLDLISDVNAGNYVALTSNNTDLSTDESVYTASNTIYALKGAGDTYGYTYENGIATWIPERTTIAYNQLNNTNWQNSNTDPYSWDRLETSGTNAGHPVHPDTNVPDEHGLAGNYYNWTASLASNDSTNATGDPTNSICPKGWRLPNVTNKEFGNLLVQYNIISTNTSNSYIENVSSVNSMGASPLYFVRGGYVIGGSLSNSGSNGYYWSSTFSNSSSAYNLYYSSSNVYPQNSNLRRYGRSVRCLARSE